MRLLYIVFLLRLSSALLFMLRTASKPARRVSLIRHLLLCNYLNLSIFFICLLVRGLPYLAKSHIPYIHPVCRLIPSLHRAIGPARGSSIYNIEANCGF